MHVKNIYCIFVLVSFIIQYQTCLFCLLDRIYTLSLVVIFSTQLDSIFKYVFHYINLNTCFIIRMCFLYVNICTFRIVEAAEREQDFYFDLVA